MATKQKPASAPTPAHSSPWGPHFRGLHNVEGVTDVVTGHGQDISFRVREAVRDRSLMLVTGAPGTGKSFAVARAVEAVQALQPDRKTVWLEMAHSMRGRALARELAPQITGARPSPSATKHDLELEMKDHLAEGQFLLVIDEAQHVSAEGIDIVRWLLEPAHIDAALVIVGLPVLEQKLPAMVMSRIMTHVRVGRMDDDAAPAILAAYHPIFAAADPRLLSQLNRTHARGEFRWWAKFLIRVYNYLPHSGSDVLTAELAQVAYADLGRGGAQ